MALEKANITNFIFNESNYEPEKTHVLSRLIHSALNS